MTLTKPPIEVLEEDLSKEELVSKILSLLRDKSTEDCAEVLANVFLEIGASSIEKTEDINIKNIVKAVFDDLEKNGETLGNSLARQGLLILSWLNRET